MASTELLRFTRPWIQISGCLGSQLNALVVGSRGFATQTLPAAVDDDKSVTYTSEGVPLHTGRPRLVTLGTGWAAARLLRDINPKLYDLTVGRVFCGSCRKNR